MKQLQIDYALADGREGTATIPNRSRIQWDLTAKARKWGSASEVPQIWATFILWDALVRAGVYDGKWDQFQDDCLVCDLQDPDTAPDADPTAPDQTPI